MPIYVHPGRRKYGYVYRLLQSGIPQCSDGDGWRDSVLYETKEDFQKAIDSGWLEKREDMKICECGHEQQSHTDKTGQCTVKDCPCDEYEEVHADDEDANRAAHDARIEEIQAYQADPFDGASGDGSLNPEVGGEG